ncbi:hypothetical protein MKS88_003350 [Plasmodium brasilianum]|uniref:Uncharacterized protein n=2 Tax=Plasmodium (Plasmodium) TaxID=418103 RepID=A0A1D3RIU3_PLAMA|nr:conserved Plasmodium protein, unknown function [Plasmodium malariae]KAI4837930.1 hypothetical protein MKS88_003350 [Plasmodium brasilianum]SCN45102.1 conserved Plasmodium protein, unknown function [Plasmodium malariae]
MIGYRNREYSRVENNYTQMDQDDNETDATDFQSKKMRTFSERDVKELSHVMGKYNVGKNFACFGGAFARFANETVVFNKKRFKPHLGIHMNMYLFNSYIFENNFIKLIYFSRWHILVYLSNNKLYVYNHSRYLWHLDHFNEWKNLEIPTSNEITDIQIVSCNYKGDIYFDTSNQNNVYENGNEPVNGEKKNEDINRKTHDELLTENYPLDPIHFFGVSLIDSKKNLYLGLNNNKNSNKMLIKQIKMIIPSQLVHQNLQFSTILVSLPELNEQDIQNCNDDLKYSTIFELSYNSTFKTMEYTSGSDKPVHMTNCHFYDENYKQGTNHICPRNFSKGYSDESKKYGITTFTGLSNGSLSVVRGEKITNGGKSTKEKRKLNIENSVNGERVTSGTSASTKSKLILQQGAIAHTRVPFNTVDEKHSSSMIHPVATNSWSELPKLNERETCKRKENNYDYSSFELQNGKRQKKKKMVNDNAANNPCNKGEIQYNNNSLKYSEHISKKIMCVNNGKNEQLGENYIFRYLEEQNMNKLINNEKKIKKNKNYFIYIRISENVKFKKKLINSKPKVLISGTCCNHGCILFENKEIYFWIYKKQKSCINILQKNEKNMNSTETNSTFIFKKLKYPKSNIIDVVYCNNTYIMISEDNIMYILKFPFLHTLRAVNFFFYLNSYLFKNINYTRNNTLLTIDKMKGSNIIKMYLTDYILITINSTKEICFTPILFHNIYNYRDSQYIDIKNLIKDLGEFSISGLDNLFSFEEKMKFPNLIKYKMIRICAQKKNSFTLYVTPNALVVCIYNLFEYYDILDSSISNFLSKYYIV